MRKSELDTPSLILDLDLFEENLIRMRDFAASKGKKLRPHAKTHKCPEIAKRQLACGNCAGICAAKLSEAEGLAEHGIGQILITSPVTSPSKMKKAVQLHEKTPELILTVDNPEQVRFLASLSRKENPLRVLLDVDPEMGRTGVPFDEAVAFGEFAASFPTLHLMGVQCYTGHLQHVVAYEERKKENLRLMNRGAEVFRALRDRFDSCRIFTGTGTGTSPTDLDIAEITDIQVGSYCVMDSEYLAVEHGGPRYAAALRMLSTVISSHYPGMATIDAGTKSLYVTPGAPPRVIDGNELRKGWEYDWSFGDEHGRLTFPASETLKAGDRLELIVSHCDPTINLFDEIYVIRGDEVLDCWQIALRGCNR